MESESPDFWQQRDRPDTNWSFDEFEDLSRPNPIGSFLEVHHLSEATVTSPQQESGFPRRNLAPRLRPDSLSQNLGLLTRGGITTELSPPVSLENSQCGRRSDGAAAGYFYVDGDGARLPRIRNNVVQHSSPHSSNTPHHLENVTSSTTESCGYAFHEATIKTLSHMATMASSARLPRDTYEAIRVCYQDVCVKSSLFSRFESPDCPPLAVLDYLVLLFLDHFPATLPFMHVPTFDVTEASWVLILAMAAVGSHYGEVEDGDLCYSMHEFLRRAIFFHVSPQIESIIEHC